MRDKGAQTMRLARDYKMILPALIGMAAKPKVRLEIQSELNRGCPLERTMAGLFIKDDATQLEIEHEQKAAKMQEDFNKMLQEQQGQKDAARRTADLTARRKLANIKKNDLLTLEKQQQAMQRKINLLQFNQRVKEAELAAKLRADEALEAERERIREQEEAGARRRAEEKESQQRHALSLAQRRHVDQQLQLLRVASLAGRSRVSVPGIEAKGFGMFADGDPQRLTVTRSGLNEWCDFCREPFGMGQKISRCPRSHSLSKGIVFLTLSRMLNFATPSVFSVCFWTLHILLCHRSKMSQSRPYAISSRQLRTRSMSVPPFARL